jgi:hypothetical protein
MPSHELDVAFAIQHTSPTHSIRVCRRWRAALFWEGGRPLALARDVRAIPLPLAWPVRQSGGGCGVAQWRGFRLPTEAEHQRRSMPSPVSAISRAGIRAGRSRQTQAATASRILVGNGWEWTPPVRAVPGVSAVQPHPEYWLSSLTATLRDEGASPTAREDPAVVQKLVSTRYPYGASGALDDHPPG